MKLITKTTILYLAIFLLGFSIAGAVIFGMLERELLHEADEELSLQHDLVTTFLTKFEDPAGLAIPGIGVRRLANGTKILSDKVEYRDTLIVEAEEDDPELEMAPFRMMRWQQPIGTGIYEITVMKAMLEAEDTVAAIVWGMVPVVLLLSLLMVMLMRLLSKAMWRPFYHSLREISIFRPDSPQLPQFGSSNTTEFAQLNAGLQAMAEKVRADYLNLKTFAENASHELQTPLAIAQSKIENLLQSSELGADEMEKIAAALEALQRIKRLNEGLLTLSKIENRQFTQLQPLAIDLLLQKQVREMAELAALREIQLELRIVAKPQLQLNPLLTDLLLSNLLINALRHNHAGGKIVLTLAADALTVSNTGRPTALDPQKLFQRFQRQEAQTPGAGLGLAIAKQICEAMGMAIGYDFQNNMHNFRISFRMQN